MTFTDDDLARLTAITNAATRPDELVKLIHDYYRDADRADRTPRGLLYLHVGMLVGAFERSKVK